jgi:phosphohistidine phosphatase
VYLYLVRHGIAVPRGSADVPNDAARPLTENGVERFRRCVRGLKRLKIEADEVWSSPLVRARQTAEIVSEGFPKAAVRVEQILGRQGDFEQLIKRLRAHRTRSGIVLVGHEPQLGEFCTYLIGGRRGSGVRLKKGGVACLEVDDLNSPVRGELCWLLTPAQLRGIK